MAKSADAFRTISEVSKQLDTPAHVLRFWESKFTQIKPIKRAGSRRYYRPEDVSLLAGIKSLLHEQGMTIKGAQKLLREKGIKHVQSIGLEERPEVVAAPEPVAEKVKPAPNPVADIASKQVQKSSPPQLEITNITAFPARKPSVTLPPMPEPRGDMAARYFGMAGRLSDIAIKAKSAQLIPILARLETARDQMRRE